MKILDASSFLSQRGVLTGDVKSKSTTLESITRFLLNDDFKDVDLTKIIYTVSVSKNDVSDNQFGGLFFGVSTLNSGSINDEYYFTRGHYHQELDTGEYYFGVEGKGLLLLHYPDGKETLTNVEPGSILYIPGKVAHRLINIGNERLMVGAVWQSISGHAYSENNLFRTHVLVDKKKGYKLEEKPIL